MTPEEAVRSYVYHPPADHEPPPWPDDFAPDLKWTPDHDRLERRLAILFGLLACFAFGVLIGKSLP